MSSYWLTRNGAVSSKTSAMWLSRIRTSFCSRAFSWARRIHSAVMFMLTVEKAWVISRIFSESSGQG